MSIRNCLVSVCTVITIVTVLSAPGFAGGPAAPPKNIAASNVAEIQIAELGPYTFEDGGTIPNLRVSFVTQGKLNEAEDNVILVLHGFGGDHRSLDTLVGPGSPLDTEKYFIIATDAVGNTGLWPELTTGPTNSGLKMDFPGYTVRDSAAIEVKLVKEYLGFEKILAVVGVSMGAMKTYQIAVDYPSFAEAIIPIIGAAEINGTTRVFSLINMDIITDDPGWDDGNYTTNPTFGVKTAMSNVCVRLYSLVWLNENTNTRDKYNLYNMGCRDPFSIFKDARNLYYQFQQVAWFKLGNTPGFDGNTDAALRSIKAKALIITTTHDDFFPRDEANRPAQIIPGAKLFEIESTAGHMVCCGADPAAWESMNKEISAFLESLRSP